LGIISASLKIPELLPPLIFCRGIDAAAGITAIH
jgi:hypothetical protein